MTENLTPAHAAKVIWVRDIKPLYNVTEIARRLGLAKGTVHNWVRIPEGHIEGVSQITGMPPHKLRPDLYSDPESKNPWDK